MEFVAVTDDPMEEQGKHYVTIWMRGDADESVAVISDPAEIAELGWFSADALPTPHAIYFENFLAGRSLPLSPANLPFSQRLSLRSFGVRWHVTALQSCALRVARSHVVK